VLTENTLAVRTIHYFAKVLAGRSEKESFIIYRSHCVQLITKQR